jgi:hypothetical protein
VDVYVVELKTKLVDVGVAMLKPEQSTLVSVVASVEVT